MESVISGVNNNKKYLIEELITDFNINSDNNKVEIYFSEINGNETLFCESGNLRFEKFEYKYDKVKNRLGKMFEIFNTDEGYKHKYFKIKINGIIVFEENINFKVLNQEYLKIKSNNYCENTIDEIRDSIKSNKLCIFDNFTNILIKHNNIDIKFSFIDLPEFNYSVELRGINIILTKK